MFEVTWSHFKTIHVEQSELFTAVLADILRQLSGKLVSLPSLKFFNDPISTLSFLFHMLSVFCSLPKASRNCARTAAEAPAEAADWAQGLRRIILIHEGTAL